MNNHRTICLHQARTLTRTHTQTKTGPVNTRKHQLLTVTTLFLFVIQSNNTPPPLPSPSALMHLGTCGRAYRSKIKTLQLVFIPTCSVVEEDLLDKCEGRMREMEDRGRDGREGWSNGDGCSSLVLEQSHGTTEASLHGHKTVYTVTASSHKNDTGAIITTNPD